MVCLTTRQTGAPFLFTTLFVGKDSFKLPTRLFLVTEAVLAELEKLQKSDLQPVQFRGPFPRSDTHRMVVTFWPASTDSPLFWDTSAFVGFRQPLFQDFPEKSHSPYAAMTSFFFQFSSQE